MDEVRVIRQTTEQVVDPDTGRFSEHIRVEFKVGDSGPFYRRFPAEGFSGTTARFALDQFAQELRLLKG